MRGGKGNRQASAAGAVHMSKPILLSNERTGSQMGPQGKERCSSYISQYQYGWTT